MPLVPLETFHLVARLQSFTEAARRLGISQPAVTQQIRRLERSLGQRLFDRAGRGITVTEPGQTLDGYAQRIFHLVDAARDAMDNLAGLRTGHLRVGASRTAGAYYIADLLDRFKALYPGVRVSLSVGNSEAILAKLLDFSLHMGLVAGPCDSPHLVSRPLIRDRLHAILPPGHRLANNRVVTARDLHQYPMIVREPGSATRRLIEQAFADRGLTVTVAMELESNEAIKSAVADRIGLGIMAHAAVAQDLSTKRLIARPLRPPIYLDFSLAYHRDRSASPVVAAFLLLLPRALPARALSARPHLHRRAVAGAPRGRVRPRSH